MPWRNDELARLFQEMAELLLLQGATAAPAPCPATAPT
jgi:hypothetical protein